MESGRVIDSLEINCFKQGHRAWGASVGNRPEKVMYMDVLVTAIIQQHVWLLKEDGVSLTFTVNIITYNYETNLSGGYKVKNFRACGQYY